MKNEARVYYRIIDKNNQMIDLDTIYNSLERIKFELTLSGNEEYIFKEVNNGKKMTEEEAFKHCLTIVVD